LGNENNDKFKFDLDAKEAGAQLEGLLSKVQSIGDMKNLSGLVAGLSALAGPIAAVTAAVLAVKVAFDFAKEGEQIEKVHKQFDAFADAVGVNSEKMKSNIEKSIGTTEDLEDALKSAQRAMSLLGENSDKIPQFFEIAKKAAAGFGGTMNERFEQITNAVAKGNAAQLRQIGITIDSEKALRDYAVSIGTTVKALSEQGRQAAISEAIIKKAEDRYKTLKVEQEGIQTATERFGQTWKETGDAVAIAFNKMFGPAFTKAIEYFDKMLGKVSDQLKSSFGEGVEQQEAQLRILGREVEALTEKYNDQSKVLDFYAGNKKAMLAETRAEIQEKKNEIALIRQLMEEEDRRKSAAQSNKMLEDEKNKPKKENGGIDKQAQLEQENKFNSELLKIEEQRIKSELEITENAENYKALQMEQRRNVEAQMDATIAETKRQGELGEILTKQQANEMIIQMEAEKVARIQAIDRDMEQNTLRVYDNQVKGAKTASDGIKAAFAQGAATAGASMKNYGTQGQLVFNSLNKNAAAAFKAMGDGSKSAGDAMKGFLFSSIADVAEAKGQFLLASGIGTMNPIEIAQGGALIALSGLLRSQAGDAGGGGVGGSSGGGGGGGASSPSSSALTEKPELLEDKKKSVTVQVMGNYFETEQTKTRMLEMIRQATDGTDFKYQQIGVGG